MPYIDSSKRNVSIRLSDKMDFKHPGELNFAIHKVLELYVDRNGLNYRTVNDIEGALGAVAKEFYRRVAKPYEKKKIKENGDISFYEKMKLKTKQKNDEARTV